MSLIIELTVVINFFENQKNPSYAGKLSKRYLLYDN